MKALNLKNAAASIGGQIVHGTDALTITDFVTKIRRLKQGALFFDKNQDAFRSPYSEMINFQCAIVTDRPVPPEKHNKNITIVQVRDLYEAYWRFIDYYRSLFDIPVIGVTGTCGKTTTKEMIRHILSHKYRVNSTFKSFNALFRNLGYLLEVDDDTQAAVYEMGVASPGDLLVSCKYFKPQVGVITNIGVDHLQAFGTIDAYIKAKAEFIEGLDYKGTLVLNADDENIRKIDLGRFRGDIVYFGTNECSHFRISDIRHKGTAMAFTLHHEGKAYEILVPGYAKFNVYNAAAAIAAAHSIGFDVGEAGACLKTFRNVEKHFDFNKGINGSIIIDDTWSTNPTSTNAALELLKSHSQGRKTIAVLGKMSLLGRRSEEYHYKIGERIADIGIDYLAALGEGTEMMCLGAIRRGMKEENIFFCRDADEAYKLLTKLLDANSIALIKTSMLSSYSDLLDKLIEK